MNYTLINKMKTKPGKRDEVISILLESGKAFDDNPACELYLVSRGTRDDTVIWVQDIWKDEASHQEAMKEESMQQYVKQAMPLLEGMPEQIEIEVAGGKHPFEIGR